MHWWLMCLKVRWRLWKSTMGMMGPCPMTRDIVVKSSFYSSPVLRKKWPFMGCKLQAAWVTCDQTALWKHQADRASVDGETGSKQNGRCMVSTCRTWFIGQLSISGKQGEGFDRFLMRLQGVGTAQVRQKNLQQWGAPVAAAREILIFASVPRHR